MMPPATPTTPLTTTVTRNRAMPSIVPMPVVTARTASATRSGPVPSYRRLPDSTSARRPAGTPSRRIVATTAIGSVAAVIAPTTNASSKRRPTAERAAATTAAEATTPGTARPMTGPSTARSSDQSIAYAAANTSPGTKTPRTSAGVTAKRTAGNSAAPASPTRTSTTDSGSPTRRAMAATAVAEARSATAASSAGAVRLVQEIEQMHDPRTRSRTAKAGLDLHETAGIGRDDDVGAGFLYVGDLALEQRAGELRLGHVVGAGASAAPVGFLERDHLEAGDRREERSWLLAHALPVKQMARIVVRGADPHRRGHGAEAEVAEELRRVVHARGELGGACRPGCVVLEKPAVLLHRRAAAGRVDDDGADLFAREGRHVPPGQFARALALAGVRVQGPAAGLRADHVHFDAVAREHWPGRRVGAAENAAHDASAEHRDSRADRTGRRYDRVEALHRRGIGQQLEHLREPRAPAQPGRAEDARNAQSLRGDGKPGEHGEHASMRQEPVERRATDRALAQRASRRREDLGARRFDELAVLDPGGAGRLARPAVEALPDVLRERGRIGAYASFPDRLHQADAAARRVHLDAEDRERRAGGKAEAAVHAPRYQLLRRRVGVGIGKDPGHPGDRPGSRMPAGSNCVFRRRIRVSPSGACGHVRRRSRSRSDRRSIRPVPPAARAFATSAAASSATASSSPTRCTRWTALDASATSARKVSRRAAASAKAVWDASGNATRTRAPSTARAGSSRASARRSPTAALSAEDPAAWRASATARATVLSSPRALTTRSHPSG